MFQNNRYGNNDIFSIKTTGSRPLRLTHHSTANGEGLQLKKSVEVLLEKMK